MKELIGESMRQTRQLQVERLEHEARSNDESRGATDGGKRGMGFAITWLIIMVFCLVAWVSLYSLISTAVRFFR